ncbi:MAG: class I SAM-dependent DNA methyltransferase [Clostridia bacterium]|nr:class I SAM-dependent DNA methyltransferase [Clostridia bacterium]
MTDKEQKQKAKEFAEFWKGKGYEKGQSQIFWTSLLTEVYGVKDPKSFVEFEDQVMMDKSTGFIDVYIPTTKVLIEQKSIEKDLRKPIKQSDGSLLTPFQQAKRYIADLPLSRHPKWVITCNFKSFLIYNMENPNGEPEEILLENLEKEYYRLQFIVDKENENLKREMEISIRAGDVVGKLYDELIKLYIDPTSEKSLKSLNMLCVRLVFCLYAEDAGLFGKHAMFHDYLNRFDARDLRRALIDLFKVLDIETDKRDPYLDEELAKFPYVNGGLFAEEDIEIPMMNDKVKELLLQEASEDFDWSEISPTIFGAIFESTLNPETRRSGGMHYTSIENIHKVIDPLFLDELTDELENKIMNLTTEKAIKDNVETFQNKLASLKFLDPACGSGNFLTETYLSLRKLENKALEKLYKGQLFMGYDKLNPIKVSIGQFFGIEINDFAVTVAKTALWIAESKMMKETETILNLNLDFLPLKSYVNIVEANALRIDWNDVVSKDEVNYIMGNPPFSGTKTMGKEQKSDTELIFKNWKNFGTLDYVACWYKKANDYIMNTSIKCAFVSTNSICQGEQVANLWEPLLTNGINIDFAYRTFIWDSEASIKAHVHCIIVGFSRIDNCGDKIIYDNGRKIIAKNINPYLVNGDNVFIRNAQKPICSNVPTMYIGCDFKDDGNYVMTEKEKDELIKKEPQAISFVRKYMMGKDFINRKPRYCLWLKDADPSELKKCPLIIERIKKVKEFRLSCPSPDTNRYAETPTLPVRLRFYSLNRYCDTVSLPMVSSQNRKYIPIDILKADVIAGGKLFLIPDITIFHFGVLTSNVHMAWMRTVAGRLKSDYSYSSGIVYNTFPWCDPTDEQKAKIEKTAQAILDARALYSNSTLADLYDELTMPVELRKAHQENDKAVMEAYGFDWRKMTESDCVAELMKMYQKLTENSK